MNCQRAERRSLVVEGGIDEVVPPVYPYVNDFKCLNDSEKRTILLVREPGQNRGFRYHLKS